VDLAALPLARLKTFHKEIGPDVKRVLAPQGSLDSRDHPGGTAPAAVRQAIARARKRLAQ
jgi:argininosuccinate lyase